MGNPKTGSEAARGEIRVRDRSPFHVRTPLHKGGMDLDERVVS